MQLVCPSDLLTFIPHVAPNLNEIQVLADEENEQLLKKSKKNYDVSHKCRNI
jgi:hypothetical protein